MESVYRKRQLAKAGRGLHGINDVRVVPYVLVAPFVLYFLTVYLYPALASVVMSFQKIDGPNNTTFVGFANYSKLLSKNYLMALTTTLRYTVWDLLVLVSVPLFFAVILKSKLAPFPNFFKSLYFIPALTSIIV